MRMSSQLSVSLGPRVGDVSAPVTFTPASLFTGGVAGGWWDPSDLSSMRQGSTVGSTAAAVDSPVGYCGDKSGNGNHLIQATSSARPILRSAGGLYWLEFDGVDDTLARTFGASIAAFDRISALRATGWYFGGVIYGDNGSNLHVTQQIDASPTIRLLAATSDIRTSDLTTGVNHVFLERDAGAASRIGVDGLAYVTGAIDASATSAFTVAAGGGNYTNIHWFGGVMIGRQLTNSETNDTRTYMGAKAGLTL